jgi:hypothetical protein
MGVPTYIPLDFKQWCNHLMLFIKPSADYTFDYFNYNKYIVYGFSARSIFNVILDVVSEYYNKPMVKVLTTPIHHTSFVSILETKTDEIDIIDLSYDFSELVYDDKLEKQVKECDIIVVTHLFGKTFNLDKLITLKNKYNKLLIVDSIMAGKHTMNKQKDYDIDIYSTGQDKRPIALGGGYCLIKDLILLFKIINTLFLYIVYTNYTLQLLINLVIRIIGVKFSDCIATIRKKNPGFEHTNYMICPNNSLIESIRYEVFKTDNCNKIEELYTNSWSIYLTYLDKDVIDKYYPFYSKTDLVVLPYNQIRIPSHLKKLFINYCDEKMIACLPNQNYATFKVSNKKYNLFVSEIMNIVTVISSETKELHCKNLAHKINEFYYLVEMES